MRIIVYRNEMLSIPVCAFIVNTMRYLIQFIIEQTTLMTMVTTTNLFMILLLRTIVYLIFQTRTLNRHFQFILIKGMWNIRKVYRLFMIILSTWDARTSVFFVKCCNCLIKFVLVSLKFVTPPYQKIHLERMVVFHFSG